MFLYGMSCHQELLLKLCLEMAALMKVATHVSLMTLRAQPHQLARIPMVRIYIIAIVKYSLI